MSTAASRIKGTSVRAGESTIGRDVSCFGSSSVAEDGHCVPLRIYQTGESSLETLVWAHGGSWSGGSLDDWHAACASVAALSGVRVVSVGYRLAPQWTHPSALRDMLAALRWASARLDDPGIQLAVGGDSAGGTLAASVALWCRDLDQPLAGQVLVYPPLDPECQAPSYFQRAPAFPQRGQLLDSWAIYRGASAPRHDERYLTPLSSTNLAGVCDAALLTGSTDPVADDVRGYAERLRRAGVRTRLCVDPAIRHGDMLQRSSPVPNPVHTWIASSLAALFWRTPSDQQSDHADHTDHDEQLEMSP